MSNQPHAIVMNGILNQYYDPMYIFGALARG